MSKKWKPQKKSNGGMEGALLSGMRKVAYEDMRIEASKVMKRAERLRDDQGLLDAAEAKRLRKAEKRRPR